MRLEQALKEEVNIVASNQIEFCKVLLILAGKAVPFDSTVNDGWVVVFTDDGHYFITDCYSPGLKVDAKDFIESNQ